MSTPLHECPNEREDRDGFEDNDGCPEEDNDKDGVPDDRDECPDQSEDVDGFEDQDGCLDEDNDGDGIADAADRCPNDAEIINVGRCNYAYKERHAFEGTDVWALVYLTGSRPDLADALERMNKGVHEYLAKNSGRR